MANAFIKAGIYRKILLIGMEVLSAITDYTDRGTCILFGDGAGAVLLEATHEHRGIIDVNLFSDGSKADLLYCEKMSNGKEFLRMNGNIVFKLAVRGMVQAAEILMKKHQILKEFLKLIIPHQANARIIQKVAEDLHLPSEKIFMNIARYGNMSSATIPIAMTEADEKGYVGAGDLVLLDAFGAGLTWGAGLIRW